MIIFLPGRQSNGTVNADVPLEEFFKWCAAQYGVPANYLTGRKQMEDNKQTGGEETKVEHVRGVASQPKDTETLREAKKEQADAGNPYPHTLRGV